MWSEGDLGESRGWFDSAYRVAEPLQDGQAMASAALGFAGLWVRELRESAAAAVGGDRLRRALAAVPDDSSLALRLRIRLAAEADYCAGKHSGIMEALAQARASGDPLATADALRLAHNCMLGPEQGAQRLELAQALIAESPRTGRRGDLLVGMLLRAVDLLLVGDPGAPRYLTELRHELDLEDNRVVRFVLQAIDVMAEIRAGRWERAELMAKQCALHGEAAGSPDAVTSYGAQIVAIRWFQGRIGEVLPMVRELTDSPLLSPIDYSFRATLAVAAAAAGERREALGAIAAFQDGLADVPSSCSSWLPSLYALTEASLLLQRADVAEEAYRLMLPYRRLPMMVGFGSACFGSVEHALGAARLAMGDVDGAMPHLRQAVHDNEALGNRPAAALARRRLAEALAVAGAPQRPALAAAPLSCRRSGKFWEIIANGRRVVVEHCRGMAYLAVLLANPGTEISAVDLASRSGQRKTPLAAATEERFSVAQSGQVILDEQAISQYRARLEELERIAADTDDVADHDDDGDGAAQAARAELAWLRTELRAATGPAGRRRVFVTEEERARVAVGKAIRRALARITALDQQLGGLISAHVRTGRVCAYAPPSYVSCS